ncbi:MAG: hypothetical protein FWD41_05520 [Actinomycetia bacterium]|nr:hypothetical protein [Actinomycetes bacterium]
MARTVKVKMNHSKRKQALIAQSKQRTMFFRMVLAFALIVMIVAAVSFGPVWLVADATRIQQISAGLKDEIADEFTLNQKLLIDEAVAKSNDRLGAIAKHELGMIEPPAATTKVWLDEPKQPTVAPKATEQSLLDQVARLAMGEASSLLVGDVSISALR